MRVHLARHLATAHGLTISSQPGGGGGSPRPAMKTRAAFCLITTVLTRISRQVTPPRPCSRALMPSLQVCSDVLKIRRAARMPFLPINIASIKQECQSRLPAAASRLRSLRPRAPKYMRDVCARLGVDVAQERPALLEPSKPRPEPKRLAFPYVPPSESEFRLGNRLCCNVLLQDPPSDKTTPSPRPPSWASAPTTRPTASTVRPW